LSIKKSAFKYGTISLGFKWNSGVKQVYVMHDLVSFNAIELHFQMLQCAKAILSADSAARKAELEAMEMTWDGEVRIVSKYCRSVSVD